MKVMQCLRWITEGEGRVEEIVDINKNKSFKMIILNLFHLNLTTVVKLPSLCPVIAGVFSGHYVQFSSVQSLSPVRLFATP